MYPKQRRKKQWHAACHIEKKDTIAPSFPAGERRYASRMRVRDGLLPEEPAAPQGLQTHQEAQAAKEKGPPARRSDEAKFP